MKNICIFICILFLIRPAVLAEENNNQEDTVFRSSLRLGFEVSYPFRIIHEPEVEQFEGSLDFEFYKSWFGVLEGGILDVNVIRDDFEYFSDGWFFRAGANFNILGDGTLKDNDKVYVGFRYGYCKQEHRADNVLLSDDYWGTYATSFEKTRLDVHWGELAAGVKTELFANIFMGWSIRLRLILSGRDESLMEPYRIAGFGKGGKSTAIDFNYSIFYRIPF